MTSTFNKRPIAIAVAATLSAIGAASAQQTAATAATTASQGKYVAGDFHNHTTCSDGSISMQKLVKKSTDKTDTPWGLDWFVQAGHGGTGSRNCTLAEDASLGTPAYPYVAGQSPSTTWSDSIGAAALKGDGGGVGGNGNMWRWQSVQEYQYPLMEYLASYKNLPLFLGLESVVAGHEHSSMSVVTGQTPNFKGLPDGPGYKAKGNANALAAKHHSESEAVGGGRTPSSQIAIRTAGGSGHGRFITWLLTITAVVLLAVVALKAVAVRWRYLRRGPRAKAAAAYHDLATFVGDQGMEVRPEDTFEELAERVDSTFGVDAKAFARSATRARYAPLRVAEDEARLLRRELRRIKHDVRERLTPRERFGGALRLRAVLSQATLGS